MISLFIHTHTYTYIYIYIYRERERERKGKEVKVDKNNVIKYFLDKDYQFIIIYLITKFQSRNVW